MITTGKRPCLEIDKGGVGSAAGELEGAEEDADADPDAVGEEEALAQVPDGVGGAGLVRVVARWVATAAAAAGQALPPLQLLDRLPQPLLRLPDPDPGGRLRRRRIAGGRHVGGGGGEMRRKWIVCWLLLLGPCWGFLF